MPTHQSNPIHSAIKRHVTRTVLADSTGKANTLCLGEVRCEYRISLARRTKRKKADSFPNRFENHWRFHCSECQGVRHALRTTDCAEWGEAMYRVSEGVRSTHGQDGAIVLDVRQGQMFNLNLVGSRILELLETGATESAIVDEISQKFEVSRDIAESDLGEFIESLKQHRLVEDSGPNG